MPPEEQHALINTCQPPVLRLYPWCLDGWAVENLADHESVDTKGHQQSFPGLPCPPVGRVSGATLYKNIPQVEGKLQDSWWKTWAIFNQLKLWNYICTLSSRRKKKKPTNKQKIVISQILLQSIYATNAGLGKRQASTRHSIHYHIYIPANQIWFSPYTKRYW